MLSKYIILILQIVTNFVAAVPTEQHSRLTHEQHQQTIQTFIKDIRKEVLKYLWRIYLILIHPAILA